MLLIKVDVWAEPDFMSGSEFYWMRDDHMEVLNAYRTGADVIDPEIRSRLVRVREEHCPVYPDDIDTLELDRRGILVGCYIREFGKKIEPDDSFSVNLF